MVADKVVEGHVARWAHRVVTRTRAHDPNRKAWDRALFLRQLYEDFAELPPADAVDLADRFERCVKRANGSSPRLRTLLDSEFTMP
jgi:hypothetical protein